MQHSILCTLVALMLASALHAEELPAEAPPVSDERSRVIAEPTPSTNVPVADTLPAPVPGKSGRAPMPADGWDGGPGGQRMGLITGLILLGVGGGMMALGTVIDDETGTFVLTLVGGVTAGMGVVATVLGVTLPAPGPAATSGALYGSLAVPLRPAQFTAAQWVAP